MTQEYEMTTPIARLSHPLLSEAAAWGLGEAHLAETEVDGEPLMLLIGSLGSPGLVGSHGGEVLQAGFQADAAALTGIGARQIFAGVLRLAVTPLGVMRAEVTRLEWRTRATLFADVPYAAGPLGAPVYDGMPARIAASVQRWAPSQAARPALRAAAHAGVRAATSAAAVATDAASRNEAAARERDSTPQARAHHLWWAEKRRGEAKRQMAVAEFLRRLDVGLTDLPEAAAGAAG
jgi:hypothetical protein